MPNSSKENTSFKRQPVVVIMGHVDHGKSSLLDYIRKSNIVAGEAGGITQHIGAYEVAHGDGKITFLDTPGHAAFTGMRNRGARVADVAVLVVACDEGVKPQTLEALEEITKARLPYIIALSKVDKPDANPDKAKQSLAESSIFVEGWGGDIPAVAVSSKTGAGVEELLDMILLQTDLLELTHIPSSSGKGIIIESHRDPRKGIFASGIIQDGTVSRGECIVVGQQVTSIRTLENHLGESIVSAEAGAPIRIGGWKEVPDVGSEFIAFPNKKDAEKAALSNLAPDKVGHAEAGEGVMVIPVVLKADTVGTLEAIEKELKKVERPEIQIKFVGRDVGNFTENDIKMIIASNQPIVIAFNTKIDRAAMDLALTHGITIHEFNIIYHMTEWLEKEIEQRIPKEEILTSIGKARILRYFSSTKDKHVVGGQVDEGKLTRGKEAKIFRRENMIGIGKIRGLQQQKNATDTVEAPHQFGMEIESKFTLAVGDVIEIYDSPIKL